MRQQTNQQGFSVVELLLTVIALGVVVFIGLYVYNTNKKPKASIQTTASTTKTTATNSTSPTTTTTPAAPTYLGLKEAGIKFQLSDAISDAYYVNNPTDESGTSVSISTHMLDGLGIAACKAIVTTGYAGAAGLNYSPTQDPSDSHAVQVGSHWYSIVANPNCKSSDTATQAKIKTVQDALVNASSTITAL